VYVAGCNFLEKSWQSTFKKMVTAGVFWFCGACGVCVFHPYKLQEANFVGISYALPYKIHVSLFEVCAGGSEGPGFQKRTRPYGLDY
jgi:hypothetical protein